MTPLKILLAVEPDAGPVVDFLRSRSYDIGSLAARHVADNAPDDARCLCVGLADAQAVDDLAATIAAELDDERARALVKRVVVQPGPLDTYVVVFVDIAALEVRQ